MSTKEIESLIKMQKNVCDFEESVLEAMKYVKNLKGILVSQKTDIIAQLELMHRGYHYGFYMKQGTPHRLESWHDEKQYDNVSHNPMDIAQGMINRLKEEA